MIRSLVNLPFILKCDFFSLGFCWYKFDKYVLMIAIEYILYRSPVLLDIIFVFTGLSLSDHTNKEIVQESS